MSNAIQNSIKNYASNTISERCIENISAFPLKFIKLLEKCLKLIYLQTNAEKQGSKNYGDKLLLRSDGKYILKNIQNLIEPLLNKYIFNNKTNLDEITDFINMVDYFDICDSKTNYLVQVLMNLFSLYLLTQNNDTANINTIEKLIEKKYKFSPLLTQAFLECIKLFNCGQEALYYQYSIGDYVTLHPPTRRVQDVECSYLLDFARSSPPITSCEGIELIPDKTHINVLNFTHNKIQTIEQNMFKDFTRLRIVDFTDNCIDTIKPAAFSSSSLEIIKLKKNNLTSITPAMFKDTPFLTTIHLEQNYLSGFNFGQFVTEIPTLKEIYLSEKKESDMHKAQEDPYYLNTITQNCIIQ